MTSDRIIELAKQAGFCTGTIDLSEALGSYSFVASIRMCCFEELCRFAKLVAAEEREACAKTIEPTNNPEDWTETARILAEAAAAIRARSQP